MRQDGNPTPEPTRKPRLRDSTKLLKERLTALHKHENIYTLPNFLTLSRLIAAPVVGYLVLHDQHLYAVVLFAYAGITDLIDGWIARRWNLQTVIGTVVDPMADKALMTILVVCLAIKGALPRKYSSCIGFFPPPLISSLSKWSLRS
jgi:cardiolipin synthase (CMP-forming)